MIPVLHRWVVFHDTLVGYIFDSKEFPKGTRVQTGPVRFVDAPNWEAECVDGKYRLGEPGTHQEHNQPLINTTRNHGIIR